MNIPESRFIFQDLQYAFPLSTVQYILPYKGLGTGIPRSYSLYPDITMENKPDENQFKVTIQRPKLAFGDTQIDKNVLENVLETKNVLENAPENVLETENVLENTPENVLETENVLESRHIAIINLIEDNVEISMLELSKKLNVNQKTVQRDIQILKSRGLLERIGPDKGGHWKIVR